MPLRDSSVRRRVVLIGAAALIVIILAALIARPLFERRASEAPAPAEEKPGPPGIQLDTPPLPVPPPPISRGEVLGLAARAASAFAIGAPPPAKNAELVGQSFAVQIPFGCEGPRPKDGASSGAYWEHDPGRGTITLRAYPETWTDAAWVKTLAAPAKFDAVEGFWIPRPWILTDDCPRPAPAPAEGKPPVAAPTERTVGLAMFFAPNSSRVQQRGDRPYEFVTNAPGDDSPIAPKGFRLTLAGRIAAFESGEPARCRENAGGRPVCLVAVEIDQVAFEDPATGKTLAEWRSH